VRWDASIMRLDRAMSRIQVLVQRRFVHRGGINGTRVNLFIVIHTYAPLLLATMSIMDSAYSSVNQIGE
jgi:hypothetical protein